MAHASVTDHQGFIVGHKMVARDVNAKSWALFCMESFASETGKSTSP